MKNKLVFTLLMCAQFSYINAQDSTSQSENLKKLHQKYREIQSNKNLNKNEKRELIREAQAEFNKYNKEKLRKFGRKNLENVEKKFTRGASESKFLHENHDLDRSKKEVIELRIQSYPYKNKPFRTFDNQKLQKWMKNKEEYEKWVKLYNNILRTRKFKVYEDANMKQTVGENDAILKIIELYEEEFASEQSNNQKVIKAYISYYNKNFKK